MDDNVNRRSGARRKIAVIAALPPPVHGVTLYSHDLLKSKLAQEFTLLHIDISDHRDLTNLGRFDFLNVYIALKGLMKLLLVCLKDHPDAVYLAISQNNVGFLRDGLFIIGSRLFSRAKIIVHHHGGNYFLEFRASTNALMRWFIGFVLRYVDVVIVLGEKFRRIFDGEVRNIAVVPNGASFHADYRRRFDRRDRKTIVSYLGNLFENKGVLDVLQAAALVKQSHGNIEFRFAGEWWSQEPSTRETAQQIIRDNHLQEHVKFVGRVLGAEKEHFLLETDIFVFPPWDDSFGLVNLEAMAAACPVISTKDVGAIPEVVVDSLTGILVEKQNPEQLAAAIIRLIEDPALGRKMGEAGRRRYEEHYTFEKCAERLIGVFENVMHSQLESKGA